MSAHTLTVACQATGQCAAADVGMQLTSVPTDLSSAITILDLTNHLLHNFTGSEFAIFPQLEEIRLTQNPINSLHPAMFRNNSRLKRVYLNTLQTALLHGYDGTRTIPADFFWYNPLLELVTLDQSGLESLPATLFRWVTFTAFAGHGGVTLGALPGQLVGLAGRCCCTVFDALASLSSDSESASESAPFPGTLVVTCRDRLSPFHCVCRNTPQLLQLTMASCRLTAGGVPESLFWYLRSSNPLGGSLYLDWSGNHIATLPDKLFYALKAYTITLYVFRSP